MELTAVDKIQDQIVNLIKAIRLTLPASREASLAITKIEEASHWINAFGDKNEH
jgi:hypothetical protein